jgi:hypothetical protein
VKMFCWLLVTPMITTAALTLAYMAIGRRLPFPVQFIWVGIALVEAVLIAALMTTLLSLLGRDRS